MESQKHPSVPNGSTHAQLAAEHLSFLSWLSESEKTADWNSPRALKKKYSREPYRRWVVATPWSLH
jgi:hypothetical protein